jgi:two-component system, NarL family, invasion response regulator UvrY
MHKIVLVDDHILIRKGLAEMITNTGKALVVFEGSNGKELIEYLENNPAPDVLLLDINMPVMNGFDTAAYLQQTYPLLKFLALSMMDEEDTIIKMLANGAKGYLLKNIEPSVLLNAIETVIEGSFYLNNLVNNKMVYAMQKEISTISAKQVLSEREIEYLRLTCQEKSHKEIAELLFISPRTVDYYRDGLFDKLQIKTRVGLVLYALKHNIVALK